MSFSRDCSVYWCDECGKECELDWRNSGDVYSLFQCVQCNWRKVFVALSDVVERQGHNWEKESKEIGDGKGRLATAL